MKKIIFSLFLLLCSKSYGIAQQPDTALIFHYFTLIEDHSRDSVEFKIIAKLCLNRKANIKWLKKYCKSNNMDEHKFNNGAMLLQDLSFASSGASRADRIEIVNFLTLYLLQIEGGVDDHIAGLLALLPDDAFSKRAKKRIVAAINHDLKHAEQYEYLAKRMKLKKAVPGLKKLWKSFVAEENRTLFAWTTAYALVRLDDEEAWVYLQDSIQRGLNSKVIFLYNDVCNGLASMLHKKALEVLIKELYKYEPLYHLYMNKGVMALKSEVAANEIIHMIAGLPKEIIEGKGYYKVDEYEIVEKLRLWLQQHPMDKIKVKDRFH